MSDRERPLETLGRGTSVGRYLLVEPIGEGATGAVYSAYDPELDRQIALKILKAGESTGSR